MKTDQEIAKQLSSLPVNQFAGIKLDSSSHPFTLLFYSLFVDPNIKVPFHLPLDWSLVTSQISQFQQKYSRDVHSLFEAQTTRVLTPSSYLLPLELLISRRDHPIDTRVDHVAVDHPEEFLLFFYYAGLVDLRRKDYKEATRNLTLVFATWNRNDAVSAIQLAAYKLMILVSLIRTGKMVFYRV
jgi:hypothetical protein